ncbi:hypothetical protein Chor_015078 [Crotalus horridus]
MLGANKRAKCHGMDSGGLKLCLLSFQLPTGCLQDVFRVNFGPQTVPISEGTPSARRAPDQRTFSFPHERVSHPKPTSYSEEPHVFSCSERDLHPPVTVTSDQVRSTHDSATGGCVTIASRPEAQKLCKGGRWTTRAAEGPTYSGVCKCFCRSKGHGFITPSDGGPEIFVHISDIEGEYVPVAGDEVTYKVCSIPPKNEKLQAVEVNIIHLAPGTKHETWSGHVVNS